MATTYTQLGGGFYIRNAALDRTQNPVNTFADLSEISSSSYSGNRIMVLNPKGTSPTITHDGFRFIPVEYLCLKNGFSTMWVICSFPQPIPSLDILEAISSLNDYKTVYTGLSATVLNDQGKPVEYIVTSVTTGLTGSVTWEEKTTSTESSGSVDLTPIEDRIKAIEDSRYKTYRNYTALSNEAPALFEKGECIYLMEAEENYPSGLYIVSETSDTGITLQSFKDMFTANKQDLTINGNDIENVTATT